MKDMHIHVRKGIEDVEILQQYVIKCINCNLTEVLLLDHGNRISPKHQAVLYNDDVIIKFKKNIDKVRREYPNIKINYGIEIDFSYDNDFRKETLNLIQIGNFDYVIGAIHSIQFTDGLDYFKAILNMIENYPIDIIGHIKLRDDWEKYKVILEEIVSKSSQKKIMIEINTSDRSIWNLEQLQFMLDLFKKYNNEFTIGSDAHSIDEIGYKLEKTHKLLRKI